MERNALRVTKGVSSRSTCRRPERLPVVPMMRDTLPSRRCRSESASIKAVLSKPVGASGRMIFSVFLRAVPVPHPISCVFQRKGWSDTGVSGAGGLVQRPSANSVNCSATGFSQDCGVSDQGGARMMPMVGSISTKMLRIEHLAFSGNCTMSRQYRASCMKNTGQGKDSCTIFILRISIGSEGFPRRNWSMCLSTKKVHLPCMSTVWIPCSKLDVSLVSATEVSYADVRATFVQARRATICQYVSALK